MGHAAPAQRRRLVRDRAAAPRRRGALPRCCKSTPSPQTLADAGGMGRNTFQRRRGRRTQLLDIAAAALGETAAAPPRCDATETQPRRAHLATCWWRTCRRCGGTLCAQLLARPRGRGEGGKPGPADGTRRGERRSSTG
ncbi:hypothetical protein I553_2773 [Mycobacterium xenopi 4042]|uniref:Uncharacterized protein n=1 Tax=Mycobacterium xenopi 4042 TaxID=1299334 RepID=X8BJQ3_MYCXE|nr:hypothetical protein I553_2773 [Mycobacterium xenopi 4042]